MEVHYPTTKTQEIGKNYVADTNGDGTINLDVWTRKTVENRPDGSTYTVYTGLKSTLGRGFFKWLGRFNVAATVVEGLISLRVEAYCAALCGSMPSGWRYKRPDH